MTLVEALQAPVVLVSLSVLFGLMVGSFLNVVIHRLPRMLERQWRAECAQLAGTPPPAEEPFNLLVPRSRCPQCGHGISALQNIPLASYIALGGHCSACRAPISMRYPLVEALAGLLAGYVAWHFGFAGDGHSALRLAAALVFAWAMIALAFIDLDTYVLPDSITLPLLWLGLLLNTGGVFANLHSAVIGAAAGYAALWLVYWAYKLATRKEGMGYGDFKLLAAIGAWLGWQSLPLVILLSSFVGAAVGIALIVFARRGRDVPIPFGPYLAVAGLIALFWGGPLTRLYLGAL